MPNPTELCTTLRMSVIDKYAHTTATDVHAVGEAAEAHLRTRPKTPSYSFPKGERDGLRPSESRDTRASTRHCALRGWRVVWCAAAAALLRLHH